MCFYNLLGWQCVLTGIGTCGHWVQMEDVYNDRTVTWASSSKYDEFHFSFSIAQCYEFNLISHVFVRRIPWAQVHFLIQRHEWCLESFGILHKPLQNFLEIFRNKLWETINYEMQELFMLFYVWYVLNKISYKYCYLYIPDAHFSKHFQPVGKCHKIIILCDLIIH